MVEKSRGGDAALITPASSSLQSTCYKYLNSSLPSLILTRPDSQLPEDTWQIAIRPPLFCFAAEQMSRLEDVMCDEEPSQLIEPIDILRNWLERLRMKNSAWFDAHIRERLAHKKLSIIIPSVLTPTVLPKCLCSERLSQISVRLAICETLSASRKHIFSHPVFSDSSTLPLRRVCMGGILDAFKVHMQWVGDLQRVLSHLGSSADLCISEQFEFLRQIEASQELTHACAYSVISKASTETKRALKELYLQLLAQKHNTTPNLAQLKVPGFTYDNIQSIDAVLELVESKPEVTPQNDAEVTKFRQKLNKFKSPSKKLRPLLSAAFVQKLEKLLSNY